VGTNTDNIVAIQSRNSDVHRLWLLCSGVSVVMTCLNCASAGAADDRGWEFEPYRVQTILAVDLPGGLAEPFVSEVPQYVARRVVAAIGPAWNFNLEIATGSPRYLILSQLAQFESPPATQFPSEGDKLVLVSLRSTPEGFEFTAREYDHFVQRWGLPIKRQCNQWEMLPEQLFALVWQTVAPLARLELNPTDDRRLTLHPRGVELWRASGKEPSINSGDQFIPVLRRTMRSGELAKDGIQVVPWTYVEVVEIKDGQFVGQIYSGTRRPLGASRQGRVEQLAIAVRSDPGQTQLRLVSRTDSKKPLAAYEIYGQPRGEGTPKPLGSTDRSGTVLVSAETRDVQMLTIKHGGQLLARLPVVPGAVAELTVPLPDDDARLAAEAKLAALREDLVDVVARRNILMARTRQKIEKRDFPAARELLRAIDELPGRSQFNLTLTSAARLLRSNDPQIQRRIDQLFEATQTVLTHFLDTGPIRALNEEFRAAQASK
jgi:hypothetical protein